VQPAVAVIDRPVDAALELAAIDPSTSPGYLAELAPLRLHDRALIDLGQRAMARYGFNLNPTFTASIAVTWAAYARLGVRAARFYAFFVAEAATLPRTAINP